MPAFCSAIHFALIGGAGTLFLAHLHTHYAFYMFTTDDLQGFYSAHTITVAVPFTCTFYAALNTPRTLYKRHLRYAFLLRLSPFVSLHAPARIRCVVHLAACRWVCARTCRLYAHFCVLRIFVPHAQGDFCAGAAFLRFCARRCGGEEGRRATAGRGGRQDIFAFCACLSIINQYSGRSIKSVKRSVRLPINKLSYALPVQ